MSKGTKYLLVSLPTSISPSNHADDALTALRSTVTTDNGTTYPFAIPNFKIGTLDALVQQADDLAKLDAACEQAVAKVGDSLRSLNDGDDERTQQHKTINDKPVDQYLRTFQWNKIKYRADKPIADLIDSLQKVPVCRPPPACRADAARKSPASTTTSRQSFSSTIRPRPTLPLRRGGERALPLAPLCLARRPLTHCQRKPLHQVADHGGAPQVPDSELRVPRHAPDCGA